jgi:hypothetical protein
MSKKLIVVLAGLAVLGLAARDAGANLPAPRAAYPSLARFFAAQGANALAGVVDPTYQIGDEWGKKQVTADSLAHATAAFRRAAMATAHAGGATSFYLGEFAGYHMMATNHHVFGNADDCMSGSLDFPLLNKSFQCAQFFGSWSDIDLALFAIQVDSPDDAQALSGVAANFAFSQDTYAEEPLLTIGFGIAENPGGELMGNQDSDCKVFSRKGEYRFMADPDSINPGDYKAWSFANGCDVSHGDSGSAMVDRVTGQPVGIIWTGKIPKSPEAQSSATIQGWLSSHDENVWQQLSYAVPAAKMGEFLRNLAAQSDTDAATKQMLGALLAPSR